MAEWVPIWVMPNLRLREAIDARQAALVPFEDGRIAQLARNHRRFKTFMSRFTDAFGSRKDPPFCSRARDRRSPVRRWQVSAISLCFLLCHTTALD